MYLVSKGDSHKNQWCDRREGIRQFIEKACRGVFNHLLSLRVTSFSLAALSPFCSLEGL